MIKQVSIILAAAFSLSTAGCVEDEGATVEKQSYKGAADPLVSANADERATVLGERFKQIQTDR